MDTAEEVLAAARDEGHPAELFLVVGADLVAELSTWHRHEDLKRLVTLAVVSRPTGATGRGPGRLAGGVGGRAERGGLELRGP